MGASQRGSTSKHWPKDNKLADRSMDKGASGSYSGAGGQAVTPIPNPPKPVAKSYAYKDGIGASKGQGIPKGGKTGLQ